MTRQEFIDTVCDWPDLIEFCRENDCDVCEGIIYGDDLGDFIAEDMRDYAGDYSWTDIRYWLNGIEDGYDFYRRDGSFEYTPVTDDFERCHSDVLSWGDDYDVWDDEEDVFLTEEEDEEEDLCSGCFPDEDFTVSDLLSGCQNSLLTIHEAVRRSDREPDILFSDLLCPVK